MGTARARIAAGLGAFGLALAAAGCGGAASEGAGTTTAPTASAGAAGKARSGAGPAARRLRVVVRGLASPVYATAAPGRATRLYVVEQAGRIRIVERGKVTGTFLDIRSRVRAGGEQGLLGLAFHPDFPTNPRFYVHYTDRSGNTRVVEYRAKGRKALPGSARLLLRVTQPYPNHNGGMLAFGPDRWLYLGLGDGGSGGDPENRAQRLDTLLGKLVRFDVDGGGKRHEIAALGLRNPWRFSFDRKSGDLWIGDVGQNAIEEIDVLPQGRRALVNFGWDVWEGRSKFEDKALGPGVLVQPIAQYTHAEGCSVVGGYVYRGKAVRSALGRYFYGDTCSGTVWSLKRSGQRATGLRKEPFRVERLVSFGEDGAGELLLVSHGGTIYRLR